jgi:hypothetical protein
MAPSARKQEVVMTTTHSTRPDDPQKAREWDTGYAYGFEDNRIQHWQRSSYSPSFLLGYDAGKAEIDELVEAAWEKFYGFEL